MKRRTVDQAYTDGYSTGQQHERERLRTSLEAMHRADEVRKKQLELMAAVTDMLKAAGQTIQALASTYDTGPRP